jgi:glycosyltransferase involved in cell wall biosynthesis
VPVFNHGTYISIAIESILKQTYADFEIIVCNDGSTDETLEKLLDFRDSRIRVISRPNYGTTSALNTCLVASRGQYICWLSADDVFEQEKLQYHLAAIRSRNCPISIAPFGIISGDSATKIEQNYVARPFQVAQFLSANYINGLSICVNRSVYERFGTFDARYRYAQDAEMWLRLIAHFEPVYIKGGSPQSFSRMGTSKLNGPDEIGLIDFVRVLFDRLCQNPLEQFLGSTHNKDTMQQLSVFLVNNISIKSNLLIRYGFHDLYFARLNDYLTKHQQFQSNKEALLMRIDQVGLMNAWNEAIHSNNYPSYYYRYAGFFSNTLKSLKTNPYTPTQTRIAVTKYLEHTTT